MKKALILLILFSTISFAQTTLKEYTGGHSFKISLPEYMSKTSGLNASAAIQYKNVVKDIYGFVIYDTKEELSLAQMNYSSLNEFYEEFVTDFLKDEDKRAISMPSSKKVGNVNFIECDASYYDKDIKTEIYYLVGIVETNTSFYKIISWTSLDKKDKFKEDFQKILYSIKD
jgi:hypothetical protein